MHLMARHDEYVNETVAELELERPGQRLTVDVVLERGATIHGLVLVDGEPSSSRVVCKAGRSSTTYANDQGEYRFDGVAPGEVELTAHSTSTRWSRGTNVQETLVVAAGETVEQELRIEADMSPITGRVVTASGAPAAGAEVGAYARDRDSGVYVRANSKSAEDGSFELEVPGAVGVNFTVSANDGPRHDFARDVPAGTSDLVLTLPDLGVLRLAVYDGLTREAVENYEVHWKPQADADYQRTWTRGGTVPGPDGVVEFELPAGTIDIAVSARNKGYRAVELPGIRIADKPDADPVEVPLVAGTLVRVRVAGEEGPDPPGYVILLVAQGDAVPGHRWSGYPDTDVWTYQELDPNKNGIARARAVTPGVYRYVSKPKGLVFQPATIEVPEQDVADFAVTWKLSEAARKQQAKGGDREARAALQSLGY